MKRILQLRELSVDHHHGLVLARRAIKATKSADESTISEAWNNVKEKFQSELEPHFKIEEKFIAPQLARKGITKQLIRFHEDHNKLRSLIKHDSGDYGENLIKFGELLIAHIRFEEEELFELTQELLDNIELASIEEASKKLS